MLWLNILGVSLIILGLIIDKITQKWWMGFKPLVIKNIPQWSKSSVFFQVEQKQIGWGWSAWQSSSQQIYIAQGSVELEIKYFNNSISMVLHEGEGLEIIQGASWRYCGIIQANIWLRTNLLKMKLVKLLNDIDLLWNSIKK